MNANELGGIVRTIAAAGFGLLVGKGYISAEIATALAGAVGTVAIAVWSVWAKRSAAPSQ